MLSARWTSPGAHPALFTVGNGPLSWEQSSRGMELFTHPNVVLILRISRATSALSMCYHCHVMQCPFPNTYVWLIVHELSFFGISTKEKQQTKGVNSWEFTKKICFFLSTNVYSYWETAKRAQFNVLFQNIILLFFSCKIANISSIYKRIVHILVSSVTRMILGPR